MQIFELHFNPKLKEGQIFDSFIYEPENIYEKKLGSLYIVGELENALSQNSKFLDNLVKVIKRNYYVLSFKSPERALSESLKKANEFLAEEVKRDNVSWLGNLNFAVLSLKDFTQHHFPKKSGAGFNLIFTKTGDLKILLIRAGQIIDIGKNLDFQEIEPYPLKIFFNIVSGKLVPNDIVLVLTKEIFEFFDTQSLLAKIAQTENLNKKKLREILPSSFFNKAEGSKISGICLLSVIKTEAKPIKRFREIFSQKKALPNFSPKKLGGQVFSPLLKPFKAILNILKSPIKKIWTGKIALPRTIFQKMIFGKRISQKMVRGLPKKPKIPTKKKLKRGGITPQGKFLFKLPSIRKKLILILVLIFFLFLGFLLFKRTEEKKEIGIKTSLNEIQEKVNRAENFLIFKNEKEANSLFKEAWREILPLTEKTKKKEVFALKENIENQLKALNKLEEIENPEVIAEPNPNLFSSPSSSLVDPPSFEFNFDLSASYLSNLYFLDKKTCEIIKYPHLRDQKWGSPKKWMKDKGPCSEPKSMTVDGLIWMLNNDNSLLRYYAGSFQDALTLDFFPLPENISKIETGPNLPYLYLLEPVQKRIIIITKEGQIFKQFRSEKFDDLKGLAVSEDGNTVWLLNSSNVYQIEL